MDIFWLGLEALPREIRATEWRSWVRALSYVGLLSRTWITRRYQRAESQILSLNFWDFLSFWDFLQKTFGTFRKSQKYPKIDVSVTAISL